MSSHISNNIVVMAAAGAGKTWDICHRALEVANQSSKPALIVTYTNRSANSAKTELMKQNRGFPHSRVLVKTWYSFLLSDLIKPYQYTVTDGKINHVQSLDFSDMYGAINYHLAGTYSRYITSAKCVRANQASELAVLINLRSGGKSIQRLEKIYSSICIDEVQDMTGYDLDLLKLLMQSKIGITCSGDNKQATFKTHNTRKNKGKSGKNIWDYFKSLEKEGLVHIEQNLVSRRFNTDICYFANLVFPTGETMTSNMNVVTGHDGVFLISQTDVEEYINIYSPQLLRFDAKTHVDLPCLNFGACKGETFERVLIYPNKPLKDFIVKGKSLESPAKYYVGVTRPRYSLAIVLDKFPKTIEGFEEAKLFLGQREITVMKYNGFSAV